MRPGIGISGGVMRGEGDVETGFENGGLAGALGLTFEF
jgi:hypothetical protein